MKKKTLFGLILATCLTGTCLAQSAPETALDRSTAELTASLLLENLRNDVLKDSPDTDLLRREMTADPGRHAEPDQARERLEPVFRDGIAARYREAAGKVLDRLSGESARNAVFDAAFLNEALALPARRLEETVDKTYPDAFSSARRKVCDEQAQTLVAGIQPTEAEFEETPRDTLTASLTARIAEAQEQPVFQENLAFISKALVRPMLEAAERQRQGQQTLVDSQPIDGWAPETIRTALERELARHVERTAADGTADGRIVYGIFPSVTNSIPVVAETRSANRIQRMVGEMTVEVDTNAVFEAIEADPASHRTADASLEAFAPALETSVWGDVLAKCKTLVPGNEWEAFEAFAQSIFDSGEMRQAVKKRVRNELLPKIMAVREACARRQADERFPDIMTAHWHPSGTLVDRVVSQVDYKQAVGAWREMPELAGPAGLAAQLPLMEEAESMLDTAVMDVFDRGRRARTRQHGIVDEVFDEMRSVIGAENKLPDMESIVGRYTQSVREVWSVERDPVLWGEADAPRPDNADVQHADLFPSTVERIVLKVKSLMEALEETRQEAEATPEIPPEEIPPEETEAEAQTPEQPELIELDGLFELDQVGSDIQLVLHVGGERVAALACSHAPARYRREHAQTVDRAVAALVTEMNKQTASGSAVALSMEIVVRNEFVYYGIVDGLADALEANAGFLSGSGVTLTLTPPYME